MGKDESDPKLLWDSLVHLQCPQAGLGNCIFQCAV